MKKAVVLALLCCTAFSIAGCSNKEGDKKETQKVEQSAKEDEKKEVKDEVKDSFKLKIDDEEYTYPEDFTREGLSNKGITVKSGSKTFLTSYGQDGVVPVEYSNGMVTHYVPDAYLVDDIDKMYLSGVLYQAESIEVVGGIEKDSDYAGDLSTDNYYINDSYKMVLQTPEDGKTSLYISSLTEDGLYKANTEEKTEDILTVTDDKLIFENSDSVDYVVDSEILTFPREDYVRNRMMSYVPFRYGFTSDTPNYIIENVKDSESIIGVTLEDEKTGLKNFSIGDNFYKTVEKLGITGKEADDLDVVKVVSSNGDESLAVYLENDGNQLSQITIVEER